MEKERKDPATVGPSFVMTLINDYSTILRLPIDFVRKYRGLMPAEYVKLRMKSGKTWDVRIDGDEEEEGGGGECFFTEGWSKFVKDSVVEKGQILVLRLNSGEGEAAVTMGVKGRIFISLLLLPNHALTLSLPSLIGLKLLLHQLLLMSYVFD